MISAQRPRPVTTDQEYLAAILEELRRLRALLETPQPAAPEPVMPAKRRPGK